MNTAKLTSITSNTPANRAWLILVIATGITFWLGEVGAAGPTAVFAMLALAFVKGRLVIYDFMELRHAPTLWKALLLGWIIFVTSMIMLAYWIGLK